VIHSYSTAHNDFYFRDAETNHLAIDQPYYIFISIRLANGIPQNPHYSAFQPFTVVELNMYYDTYIIATKCMRPWVTLIRQAMLDEKRAKAVEWLLAGGG
jgi:hypothetical protein